MDNKLLFEYSNNIDANKIVLLLCTAFDSGSVNYWCSGVETILPKEFDLQTQTWLANPSDWANVHKYYIAPLVEGGSVIFDVAEDDDAPPVKHVLDINSIKRGIRVMSEKYPKHWSDVVTENDDAITGDVFIQCCLFGELIYG